RSAKATLGAFEVETRKLKEFVSALNDAIAQPDRIGFEGYSYQRQDGSPPAFTFRDEQFNSLTPQYLRTLGDNIRKQKETIARLREELTKLEGEDPGA
ncbi:MAG: hypothetical protein WCA20_31220, partial [Candidatus Sulfotelmatobacter sp.]